MRFLLVILYSFVGSFIFLTKYVADIFMPSVGSQSNAFAFVSRFITIARSYTLSDIANVESSLFAVPINHIFFGSFSCPPFNNIGSLSHLSLTTSRYLLSGFGNSNNDKNSAK